MYPRHRNQKNACLLLLLGFIMEERYCEIMKNKMCVLFELDNHVHNLTTVIGRIAGTTKNDCFYSCVRTTSCRAFHFRQNDGNCELLETSGKCMSHDVTMGTEFVQLTQCDKKPPWKVVSPALNKLQWRGQYDIGDHMAVRTRNGERGVVRALYEGIYLSGFFLASAEIAYVEDMDCNPFQCSPFNQVLTCADPADYSWLHYDQGEPVPLSAVVCGYWQDGAPLYVVSVKERGDWKPGYYNALNKELHVARMRSSFGLSTMLLVETWFDWERDYGVQPGILVGSWLWLNLGYNWDSFSCLGHTWGHVGPKQVSRVSVNSGIPQYCVGCNILSMPFISGTYTGPDISCN